MGQFQKKHPLVQSHPRGVRGSLLQEGLHGQNSAARPRGLLAPGTAETEHLVSLVL